MTWRELRDEILKMRVSELDKPVLVVPMSGTVEIAHLATAVYDDVKLGKTDIAIDTGEAFIECYTWSADDEELRVEKARRLKSVRKVTGG